MIVHSLGFRTDLALLRLGGSQVTDYGDHLSITTPENPSFYWGNFLLLASAPPAGEAPRWLNRFAALHPQARHVAVGVDTSPGTEPDLSGLHAAGLTTERSVVLTSQSVHPPRRPSDHATIRPLTSNADWAQQIELTMVGESSSYDLPFASGRAAEHRAMVQAGHGAWWGAFVGDRLLSSLGLFRAERDLARFQSVKTHPDARNQGLAGTLLHTASQYGFTQLGATRLVIVADPDYLAIDLYRSVGFADAEDQWQAIREPA